jgi:hypothetical protein
VVSADFSALISGNAADDTGRTCHVFADCDALIILIIPYIRRPANGIKTVGSCSGSTSDTRPPQQKKN